MKISIFGLGYVGCVTAACLSRNGHDVIGVDINEDKVEMINKGISPIIEKDINSLVSKAVKDNKLKAVISCEQAIKETEISLICVGTPSKESGELLLESVIRVSEDIGKSLAKKEEYHTVVIRSTLLPGTTRNTVIPILEDRSGKLCLSDFMVVYNPEFLREGSSVFDFYNPPKIVIGELIKNKRSRLIDIYNNIPAPIFVTSIEVAEAVKYVDNIFHSLKVVFANEIGNYCKAVNLDSFEVMDIFCSDDKLNISPAYLKPGFAFGGSCLPKDLRALLYDSKQKDLELPLMSSIFKSNELHIKRAFNLIKDTGLKKLGFLGFSFKEGTDDTRESPVLELIERLIGKGYEIKIYDINFNLSKLIGANKELLMKHLPHINNFLEDDIESILGECEVIVASNNEKKYLDLTRNKLKDKVIVDLSRLFCKPPECKKYIGICW